MKIPSEIVVHPYTMGLDELREQSVSCPSTSLFAKEAQLGKVTELALKNYDHRATFAYASVGCSIGAELDSVAALLSAQGVRQAAMCGIDIDQTTLKVAENGQYIDPYYLPIIHGVRSRRLRNLGFETSTAGMSPGSIAIDARPVREQHKVNFYELDLGQETFDGSRQDLITCHNVLPHVTEHDPSKARAMIGRLCSLVARGGILSIAATEEWHESPFASKDSTTEEIPSYGYFHGRLVSAMCRRYNMEIVLRDKQQRVVALRKTG